MHDHTRTPNLNPHAQHICSNNPSASLAGDLPEDSLDELSHRQLHLTAACMSHFVSFKKALCSPSDIFSSPSAPPRMFIAQKIISQVISAPLWAAINFSSLHDGPACGHRSLTFSKRSINLSVHPATYPLMFSSCTVVFFLSLVSGCRLLGGKWL